MPLVANSMTTLERLRCHRCGKQMMLARVTPKTPRTRPAALPRSDGTRVAVQAKRLGRLNGRGGRV